MPVSTFAVLAGGLGLLGSVQYLRDTVRGRTRPNRTTWLIWTLLSVTVVTGQLRHDPWEVSALALGCCLGTIAILVAAIVRSDSRATVRAVDLVCGALAIGSLALSVLATDPQVGIALAIATEWLGGIPTMAKVWRRPRSENAVPFLLFALGGCAGLGTVKIWAFTSFGFAAHAALYGSVMAALIAIAKVRTGRSRSLPQVPSKV